MREIRAVCVIKISITRFEIFPMRKHPDFPAHVSNLHEAHCKVKIKERLDCKES